MAKIANDFCKKVFITDDNPRKENPKKIRKELLKHISKKKTYDIGNRSLAIKTAVKSAELMKLYWLQVRDIKSNKSIKIRH